MTRRDRCCESGRVVAARLVFLGAGDAGMLLLVFSHYWYAAGWCYLVMVAAAGWRADWRPWQRRVGPEVAWSAVAAFCFLGEAGYLAAGWLAAGVAAVILFPGPPLLPPAVRFRLQLARSDPAEEAGKLPAAAGPPPREPQMRWPW